MKLTADEDGFGYMDRANASAMRYSQDRSGWKGAVFLVAYAQSFVRIGTLR